MNILYAEDDPRDADLAQRELAVSAPHFELDKVATQREALARLEGSGAQRYDLVLADLCLPDGSGLDLLAHIRERALPLAVVIITGQGDEETAVAALKVGADDYIVKRGNYLARLPLTLEDALQRFRADAARSACPLRVLYAEHNAVDIDLTRRHLARHAPYIQLDVVNTAVEVLQRLPDHGPSGDYDIIMLDYNLPGLNALEVLKELRQVRGLDVPIVLVTGRGDEEVAVQALKLGATDYVVKNVGYLYQLPSVLENGFHRVRLAREQAALQESEARYRELADSITDIFFAMDEELRYTYWNRASEELTGVPAKDALGKSLYELFPDTPATREAANVYLDVLRTQQPWSFVSEYQLGGRDFSFEISAYPAGTGLSVFVKDITERKRAADELRLAHREWERIFQAIGHPTLILDTEHNVIKANRAAARAIGSSEEELRGKKCYEVFHRSDQSPEGCPLQKMLVSGHLETVEMEMEALDGVFLVSCTPVLDDRGHLQRVIHIATDITERKRAEEALEASEQKYRGLHESMMDAFVRIDMEGNILEFNTVYQKMLGYSAEKLSELTYKDITPSKWHSFEDRIVEEQILQRGYSDIYAKEYQRKDGGVFPVELRTFLIQDESGRPEGMWAIVRDITERVRAERLLHALNQAALAMERALTHEQIFAAVAEELKELGFSCAVFPMDVSRSRLFTKYLSHETRALKAVERLVGLKHEDFSIPIESVDIYREVVREKKPFFAENAAKIILQQLLPEPAKRLAGQIVRRLKVPKSIIAPLIVEDEVIGVLSVQSGDLTKGDVPAITAFAHQVAAAWHKANLMQELQRSLEELERTQDQLVQAQKMEAIGRLAGGVAHDFNNLLTAIIGYSDLALMSVDRDDPMHKDVEEIKKAADRAASLTSQLLAFSRKQVLQPMVLNLNATVADMEKMLRRLVGEDVELVTVLDPALGRVKADPGQIEQVLLNLAVNARDAMPQGGKLTIETTNIVLDEDYARQHVEVQAGHYIMLAVSDTGVGMDDETQSHLFEPFFTTKEVGRGTGLGLATVYGIVKQSGGHLWVYSELGQGTTFKIYLPRVEEAAEADQRVKVSIESLPGRETVLLVEDEDIVRDLVRRVLFQSGYTLLEARNGREALLICERHEGPIHLLVTDVVMPGGMSGRQLAERLATLRPEMGVLYMSGYTDDAIVRHGVLEPGVAFLQKPFTPAALAHLVRQVLDSS